MDGGKPKYDLHAIRELYPMVMHGVSLSIGSQRVAQVQAFLGREILLENVSSYLTYKSSEMSEWQFFNEVDEKNISQLALNYLLSWIDVGILIKLPTAHTSEHQG
ncbi:hypothetical protein ND16A_1108 [Thalassotalea sp. ND16A]|nr:hypothetical protein ND16A_1108 [Thalassotalea sp. ND16A]